MHKTLKFASHLVPLVLNGSKKTTWRLFDDKELSVGDSVVFLEHGTGKQFGRAKITQVRVKELGELTDEDWEGHERFSSQEEMYTTYKTYYTKNVDSKTLVKVIKFVLL